MWFYCLLIPLNPRSWPGIAVECRTERLGEGAAEASALNGASAIVCGVDSTTARIALDEITIRRRLALVDMGVHSHMASVHVVVRIIPSGGVAKNTDIAY